MGSPEPNDLLLRMDLGGYAYAREKWAMMPNDEADIGRF